MKVFCTVFLLALSLGISAQNQFGLNGGIQLVSLHDTEGSTNDFQNARIGVRLGGFYEHSFTDKLGLHAELNYSLAGLKGEDNYFNMHYLSCPLLVFYAPVKRLKIYLGPEVNLLLGTDPVYKPLGESFNKVDPGIALGFEFLASEKVGITLRNYFGLRYNTKFSGMLNPVDGGDPVIVDSDDEIKMNRNNMLQIGINYYFKK